MTATHDIATLTAAVLADPTDADLRLVLADAHEEAGNQKTAEWLRLDVATDADGFVCPFSLNARERVSGHRPAGMETLWDAKVIAKTGKRPVSMLHRLPVGSRRR